MLTDLVQPPIPLQIPAVCVWAVDDHPTLPLTLRDGKRGEPSAVALAKKAKNWNYG